MNIADLRKDYKLASLAEGNVAATPLVQFEKWLNQAIQAQLPEPNAMTLATVGAEGRPSTRVVLIKGIDERGPVWFTNYQSRKGRELAANPHAALQFHWVELERVVRLEGRVEKISEADSDATRAYCAEHGIEVVIPSHPNRTEALPMDEETYRDRNKIERFFGRLKQYRRLATRYDKTIVSFLAFWYIGAALDWLR